MVPEKSKRLSLRPTVVVMLASLSACALIWTARGMYVYWNDIRLVNFLAAWIPFVLSLLLAFVPEHKMTPAKKLLWRSSVIMVGFIWSVVLWHQQVITDKVAREDQERIVNQAVNKSNEHSDQKIKGVQEDVGGVKQDVGGVKLDLQKATDTLSTLVTKTESDLTISLGKVGKPDPPELVRLQASLWPTDQDFSQWPIVKRTIAPDQDGLIPVELTFRNISGTAASNADIWIALSPACHFAIEPAGFDRPKGATDNIRHRLIQLLNPGVTMEKMIFLIKEDKPFSGFEITFRYSCQGCGPPGKWQALTIIQGYKPFG